MLDKLDHFGLCAAWEHYFEVVMGLFHEPLPWHAVASRQCETAKALIGPKPGLWKFHHISMFHLLHHLPHQVNSLSNSCEIFKLFCNLNRLLFFHQLGSFLFLLFLFLVNIFLDSFFLFVRCFFGCSFCFCFCCFSSLAALFDDKKAQFGFWRLCGSGFKVGPPFMNRSKLVQQLHGFRRQRHGEATCSIVGRDNICNSHNGFWSQDPCRRSGITFPCFVVQKIWIHDKHTGRHHMVHGHRQRCQLRLSLGNPNGHHKAYPGLPVTTRILRNQSYDHLAAPAINAAGMELLCKWSKHPPAIQTNYI